MTVALDENPENARPWIEAAGPTHPALIDTQRLVADRYNIVNVPTLLWIDERGHIVRPNDVAFGNDRFKDFTGLEAAPHLAALRAWVRGSPPPFADDRVRALLRLPSEADQRARAEFGLGIWLFQRGRTAAAARHFERAGELAPHDFTIRRGTLRMRGQDPFGPAFREMHRAWTAAGQPFYRPLPD